MYDLQGQERKKRARIWYIVYVTWAFLVVIIIRLFYLQIENGIFLKNLGERNFLRIEHIYPLRGNLLDRKGILLAANRPVFDLYWQGGGALQLDTGELHYLKKVEKIIDRSFLLDEPLIKNLTQAEKTSQRFLLKKNITFEQLCQISEQCAGCPRFVVENRFERIYPHHTFASHILGYLNRIERVGRTGVERVFQNELQGRVGYVVSVINSTGKRLEQKEGCNATAGADLTLTLDFHMQKIAETLFTQDQAGAFMIMDPENGAIRAFVSYPNFDPNLFLSPISEEEWQEKMANNNPLLNRVTSTQYPPASTFKLVTMAAGLEEKIITPKTECFCHGYVEFCGRKCWCMQHKGHGRLTPRQALTVSCNVMCFEIAKKIKIDTLADYARRFGLGQKTNFLLPDGKGLIPTIEWKKRVKNERWWKGETLSASIGQSYLLVTPLQVIRMVSGICAGHLTKPRIIENEPVENSVLSISKETLKLLRESMGDVVQFGTVRLLSFIKGFDVHAKSGTAQTCSLEREKTSKNMFEHGWVTGYFTYKDEKPLAFIVFVEHAGSSHPALEIARNFLCEYKKLQETKGL